MIRLSLALAILLAAPNAFAQTTFTVTEFKWDDGGANMLLNSTASNEYILNKAECYELLELGTVPDGCDTSAAAADPSVSTKEITLRGTFSDTTIGQVSIWVGECDDSEPKAIDGVCTEVLPTSTVADADDDQPYVFDTVDLIGTDCSTDEVEVLLFYTDALGQTTHQRVSLEIDATAPAAPTLTDAAGGESNVDLTWDSVSDSDLDEYVIYYGTGTFTSDTGTSSSSFGGSSTTGKIEGLSNGKTYNFGIVAVDVAGNSSTFCEATDLISATPVEVFDGWEYYRANGGTEEGGYCYVATAAWNSPLAPAVTWLRGYRDARMLTNDGGRALVDLYNVVGPEAAALIKGQPWLQNLVRWLLVPMILCAVLFAGWPVWGPLFGGALAFLYRRRRKSVQKEGASS